MGEDAIDLFGPFTCKHFDLKNAVMCSRLMYDVCLRFVPKNNKSALLYFRLLIACECHCLTWLECFASLKPKMLKLCFHALKSVSIDPCGEFADRFSDPASKSGNGVVSCLSSCEYCKTWTYRWSSARSSIAGWWMSSHRCFRCLCPSSTSDRTRCQQWDGSKHRKRVRKPWSQSRMGEDTLSSNYSQCW